MQSGQAWIDGVASLDIEEEDPRFPIKNEFFERFFRQFDCGPADGGCLVMAQAIRRAEGGDLWVIHGVVLSEKEQAQHAVVRLPGGQYADAYGEGSDIEIIENLRRLEPSARDKPLFLRPFADGDLLGACRCGEDEIAELSAWWSALRRNLLSHECGENFGGARPSTRA